METARSDDEEPNLTKCSVCHDTFRVPKLLRCSHIFCRHCLVTWLQSQLQAACPICRCAIVDPVQHGGRSVEEVADGFPTDLAMTAMVEAETLLSKQHVCCVCVDVAAVALCLRCRDSFCQHCSNVHKKNTATKHHEVEQLSSLTKGRLATHQPATCPDHKEAVSEMHCSTHGISICVLCANTIHLNCLDVVSRQSHVENLTAEICRMETELVAEKAKIEEVIDSLDKLVEKLQSDLYDILEDLEIESHRLKEAIDARFLHLRNETIKTVSEVTKKANDLKNDFVQSRNKMAAPKTMIECYKQFEGHKYFEDMVTLAKCRMEEIKKIDRFPQILQLGLHLVLDNRVVGDIKIRLSGLGLVALC